MVEAHRENYVYIVNGPSLNVLSYVTILIFYVTLLWRASIPFT
jgi:hypothetical protein